MSVSPRASPQSLQDPAQKDTFARARLSSYDESVIGTALEASEMRTKPLASVLKPRTAGAHAIGKENLDDSVMWRKPLSDHANSDIGV